MLCPPLNRSAAQSLERSAVYEYGYIWYTPATAWVFEEIAERALVRSTQGIETCQVALEIAELAGYVLVDDTGSLWFLDKWHGMREESEDEKENIGY